MAEMAIPAAAKGKKLYARKSSGLVRTIGVFGAMVFGVHCISLSSSGLIPFSWVAGVWPGSSIIGVLTVAMFFCLFHAYTYAVIGATMPHTASAPNIRRTAAVPVMMSRISRRSCSWGTDVMLLNSHIGPANQAKIKPPRRPPTCPQLSMPGVSPSSRLTTTTKMTLPMACRNRLPNNFRF